MDMGQKKHNQEPSFEYQCEKKQANIFECKEEEEFYVFMACYKRVKKDN